jgi:hypothetical protein
MKTIGHKIDISTDEKNNWTISYLSKLSHLPLWESALNRNAKTLATNNIYLLKDEYSKLENLLSESSNYVFSIYC